jgi:hypothetical protein
MELGSRSMELGAWSYEQGTRSREYGGFEFSCFFQHWYGRHKKAIVTKQDTPSKKSHIAWILSRN